MRTHQNRGVPVKALVVFPFSGLRFDIDDFARGAVGADQVALLPLRIHNVRVARFSSRLVSVAKERHKPIGVANAVDVGGARGATVRIIILRAAVDIVERLRVVDRHFIVLRDG